jgi:tetratricopeptide (TPR) repeat protein
VTGADLHVGPGGVPLYLLTHWSRPDPPSAHRLAELPSRLLDARHRVVPFTGRDTERDEFREWRDDDAAFAVRWLHGPGGQGKTRLADEIAAEAHAQGWAVVTASAGSGPIHRPVDRQDLGTAGARGVLLVVDYADRWPLSHLLLLLENRLLTGAEVPVRVLFLGRTDATWQGLTGVLDEDRMRLSSTLLAPLDGTGDARSRMFEAARTAFLDRYGTGRGPAPQLGDLLDAPGFGLVLAVHMAALVSVDRDRPDQPLPADVAALTMYLLDREQLHWANRYGRDGRLQPDLMRRVVFVATLCGTRTADEAAATLSEALPGHVDPALAADDHAACYPPDTAADRLQPLYPDRLAEDFVALTLTGHTAPYPAESWAGPLLGRLLTRDPRGAVRPWHAHAMATLAAAALRWEHLGAGHLYPVLRRDPALAVEAGGNSLVVLATAERVDLELLTEIEPHLPKGRHLDLDLAALTVLRRLAERRLAVADGPRERGHVHVDLGYRLNVAGHREQARTEMAAAVDAYRLAVVREAVAEADDDLAHAVMNLAHTQLDVGDRTAALASAEEARELYRALAARDPAEHEPDLAYTWSTLGTVLAALGRHEEAVAACAEAVGLYERLAEEDRDRYEGELAGALGNRGIWRHGIGDYQEALADVRRAAGIYRRRAADDPNAFLHEVAAVLVNEGMQLNGLRRFAEAAEVMTESVAAYRTLARMRPESFEHFLATALSNLSEPLAEIGRTAEALAASAEAVTIRRRLAGARPAVFAADLAVGLNNYAVDLLGADRAGEALIAVTEAVAIRRRLAESDSATYGEYLASSLNNLGQILRALGRPEEAVDAYAEAGERYRVLAAERPAAHRAHLVAVLNGQARTLIELGHPQRAITVAEESCAVSRELGVTESCAVSRELGVTESLAESLTTLAVAYRNAARAAADEAGRLYAGLPAEVRERPRVRQFIDELAVTG